jgi:glutathione S-transferase
MMDEYVHNCCTVLTFATANRQNLLQMSPEALEAELAKNPSRTRAEAKRQVAQHGLDAPIVVDALRQHRKLLDWIDSAMQSGPYIAGADYSLADIAATPYIWRLGMLRLSKLWDDRPGVAAWFERVRQRPSFAAAVDRWLTDADRERYAKFQPDPWPRVQALLRAA